ncbi:unnamed protein product, partial [Hymenolepis diminuta]
SCNPTKATQIDILKSPLSVASPISVGESKQEPPPPRVRREHTQLGCARTTKCREFGSLCRNSPPHFTLGESTTTILMPLHLIVGGKIHLEAIT